MHVLAGLGGSGKTTIALELVRMLSDGEKRVWWVDASNQAQLMSAMMQIAQDDLGVPNGSIMEALAGKRNAADLFWEAIFEKSSPGSYMLILDNADNPDDLILSKGSRLGDGNSWVRGYVECFTLVTSRDRNEATWGSRAVVLPVGPLDSDAATTVLLDLAPNARDVSEAGSLAESLNRLPLALHLVGTHIGSPYSRYQSFADYRNALTVNFKEAIAAGDLNAVTDRETISRTWATSIDALTDRGVAHADLLMSIIAQFSPGKAVPLRMFQTGRMRRALGVESQDLIFTEISALGRVGLVDEADALGLPGLLVHPLVADTVRTQNRSWKKLIARPNRWRWLFISHWSVAVDLLWAYSQDINPRNPGDWPQWHLVASHLRALISNSAQIHQADVRGITKIAAKTVYALWAAGNYVEAEDVASMAGEIARKLPKEDLDLLRFEHYHAILLTHRGEFEKAESLLKRITSIRQCRLGEEHPETLGSLHSLAVIAWLRGDFAAATPLFEVVFLARRRVLGRENEETLRSQHSLAAAKRTIGEYQEAAALYQDVIDIRRRILGDEHPETLSVRHGYAMLIHENGQYDQAERQYREILEIQERRLGPKYPDTIKSRYDLAELYRAIGRIDEAKSLYESVIAARVEVLGLMHPDTILAKERMDQLESNL
ncbi:tetratricopeptide repeat protein [Streptosporangium vulgare]|uniref:Tetratricopeptide repeat protein n=1 Tax=Streptosporangium vulgare TaxID=46190 RepID=A0ABV5TM11_9ACTN